LLWASKGGHAETVRVLVELGASVEAVDEVNIHAHALANTCCIKHVSGIMRMTMIIMSPVCVTSRHTYIHMCVYIYIHTYIHTYEYIHPNIYIDMYQDSMYYTLSLSHTHRYSYI
jgi:hypothetical protein